MRKVLIFFALFLVAIDVSICVGNSVMFSSLDRRLEGCKIEDAGDWLREDEKHHSYHVEYVGKWVVVKSSYTSVLGVIYLITKIVGSIALLLGGFIVLLYVSPVGQSLIEKTGYVLP